MSLTTIGLKEVYLDLHSRFIGSFFAKEGERNSRGLLINVLDEGVGVTLSGMTAKLFVQLKDGRVYESPATLSGNKFKVVYPAGVLKSGKADAEIRIYKGVDNIASRTFQIDIERAILSDDLIQGEDELSLIEKLLVAARSESERLANEYQRVEDEQLRQENEIIRQQRSELMTTKVARLEKEIQQHKSTIASVNVNQEARHTAEGRRAVSLPKTSGEGHGEFGLQGLTATNLVEGRVVQPQVTVSFDIASGNQYYDSFSKGVIVGNDTTRVITNDTEKEVNILAINLTQTFGAGNEPTKEECDKIFANYFEGTQSVNGNVRVKSVGKNLFDKEDIKYGVRLIATGVWSPTSELLTSHKIKIDTRFKYVIKNNRSPSSLGLSFYDKDFNFIVGFNYNTPNKYVSYVGNNAFITDFPSGATYFDFYLGLKDRLGEVAVQLGSTPTPYESYTESTYYLNAPKLRSLPNGVRDEMKGDKLIKRVSDTGELLKEPEIIPLYPSGNLITRPSGTVYIEDVAADVATYSNKAEVGRSELLIKEIDKLSVMDFTTGNERNLDVSKATISEDKLSFTHPDLTNGDIVFFEYYYTEESTDGLASVEYFDSRYTIKDSVTDKHYKWSISIAEGVPKIELEEV